MKPCEGRGRQRRRRQAARRRLREIIAAKRMKPVSVNAGWGAPTPPTSREVFKIVARGNESRLESQRAQPAEGTDSGSLPKTQGPPVEAVAGRRGGLRRADCDKADGDHTRLDGTEARSANITNPGGGGGDHGPAGGWRFHPGDCQRPRYPQVNRGELG